ncbi:MAG: hypothetical protein KC466_07860 [Myxococcales bacterium]|nr:hypothetical protein [Myxococcales bacterium]
MIEAKDEALHPLGAGAHWQESFYFNWADPARRAFGLTRIGYRFTDNQIDGLVLTIRDGRPEFVYPAVNLKGGGPWSDHTPKSGLRARGLVYRMEEPLGRWRIELRGKDTIDLTWTAFTPAFDYHGTGENLVPNLAARHFEQTGRVRGTVRLRGRETPIDGTGQRDKSWGPRDWARIEGWNWISAQFGEDLSFNAWEGWFEGRRYLNGYLHRGGENHALRRVDLTYRWTRARHLPASARLVLTDDEGVTLEVEARPLGNCPLVKRGLWIEEIFASFTARVGGEAREGIGVVEHAWHAGTLGTLREARRVAAAAWDLRPR